MDKRRYSAGSSVGVGISSILMIFVALCMTIFATLSYLSARADYKLTEKAAALTRSYYIADSEAEQRLAAVSEALSLEEPSRSELLNGIGAALSPSPRGDIISYEVPIDGKRLLHVELLLTPSAPSGLTRLVWRAESLESALEEPKMNLLQDFSFLG